MIKHIAGNRYYAWRDFSFEEIENIPHSNIVLEAEGELSIAPNFSRNNPIKRIRIIADTIRLCDGAFMNLKEVKEITLEGKIVNAYNYPKVNELLFEGCTRLETIRGVFSGEMLMPHVFRDCESLVDLPVIQVKDLGLEAFSGCRSLKRVRFGNGLESLGIRAFKDCVSLEDVYLPNSVRDLGGATFANCSALRSIHLPDNVSWIPHSMFEGCISLQKCFLSDSIEHIGDRAFYNCVALKNPWIPKNLKRIGAYAFSGCTSITEILLPESLEEIGENAFAGCIHLRIKGTRGSFAHRYAQENQIPFLEI